MSANVSLATIYKIWTRADENGNGTLSRKEMAREALRLKSENKTYEYQLFARMAVGGTDKNGMFPDFFGSNGRLGSDSEVGFAEMAYLAFADYDQSDGDINSVSDKDFRVRFGSRYDNSAIDQETLQDIAYPGRGTADSTDDLVNSLTKLLPLLGLLNGGNSSAGGTSNNSVLNFLLTYLRQKTGLSTGSSSSTYPYY